MKLFFKHTIEGEVAVGITPQIIETILGNHPAGLNLLVALLKSPIHTSI